MSRVGPQRHKKRNKIGYLSMRGTGKVITVVTRSDISNRFYFIT